MNKKFSNVSKKIALLTAIAVLIPSLHINIYSNDLISVTQTNQIKQTNIAKTYYQTEFYNANDPLGTATHFHIFAQEIADTRSNHTHGNIATKTLFASEFGISSSYWNNANKENGEISYARILRTINPSATANLLVLGSDYSIKTVNNGAERFVVGNGLFTKLDNVKDIVFEENQVAKPYIDLDKDFAILRQKSQIWGSNKKNTDGVIINSKDQNNLSIDFSNVDTANGYTFVNLRANKDLLRYNNKLSLIGLDSNSNNTGVVVINVDLKGYPQYTMPFHSVIAYGKNGKINQNVSANPNDFGTSRVVFNFIDTSKPNLNYTGTVSFRNEVIASIFSPSATVKYGAVNGTIVGKYVYSCGQESHRRDIIPVPDKETPDIPDTETSTETSSELTSESTSELTSETSSETTSEYTSELTSESTSKVTTEYTSESTSELTSESTTHKPSSGKPSESTSESTSNVTTEYTSESTSELTSESTTHKPSSDKPSESTSETTSKVNSETSSETTSENTSESESNTGKDDDISSGGSIEVPSESTTSSSSSSDSPNEKPNETTTENTTETTTSETSNSETSNSETSTETTTKRRSSHSSGGSSKSGKTSYNADKKTETTTSSKSNDNITKTTTSSTSKSNSLIFTEPTTETTTTFTSILNTDKASTTNAPKKINTVNVLSDAAVETKSKKTEIKRPRVLPQTGENNLPILFIILFSITLSGNEILKRTKSRQKL